ncbi:uncharacterized protein LOC131676802 [Topomyia yanbarensis]|uniref:uncharacterized protein LOC131676802 n=1 Tax=Topomyia yanbarensis TaxID=2498891 RepID=UPI00273B8B47|nr:uncharacterized protein LOC131676802 [Topomyia yanbarensis]
MCENTPKDPLKPARKLKYCAGCGNNTAIFSGTFVPVPRDDEECYEWMLRLGMKPDEPVPRSRNYYVCEDHFDPKYDFIRTSQGARVRLGVLPWRNLRTGTHSYHGLETVSRPQLCECTCCNHLKTPVTTPTTPPPKLQYRPANIRPRRPIEPKAIQTELPTAAPAMNHKPVSLKEIICRLCFQNKSLTPLFCLGQPLNPSLLSKIYATTGVMINMKTDAESYICELCQTQIERMYEFQAQIQNNNDWILWLAGEKKRKKHASYVARKAKNTAPPPGEDQSQNVEIEIDPLVEATSSLRPIKRKKVDDPPPCVDVEQESACQNIAVFPKPIKTGPDLPAELLSIREQNRRIRQEMQQEFKGVMNKIKEKHIWRGGEEL